MERSNGRRPLSAPASPATEHRIVVVTATGVDAFTPEQVARLRSAGEVIFHRRATPIAPGELAELLAGATVAGVTPRSVPDLGGSVVAALPDSLQAIVVFATGVDFVDLEALARRGIALAHLPEYSAASVAEHTIALLLTLSRRIHLSRDRVLGRVPATTSVRGWELNGKTLGVVGAGRIGGRVIALAEALGMRVLVADSRLRGEALENVLAQAHVVSLHVPLRHGAPPLIGRAEIAAMRPRSFLVNVSRAGLVDEEAVIDAISLGYLAGYAVDDRIRNRERAARLLAEGRIVESGHTAWYSDETLRRGLEAWVDTIVGLAVGEPRNLVTAKRELVPSA